MRIIRDLEHYRLEHRLTYAKLAEKLGVHLVTVQRWASGTIKPGKIHEYQIKKLLGRKIANETKEEVIDQDFIKHHTKNGIFTAKAKYGDEAELMTIEYNKSLTPEQRIDATQYLREQYYLVKGLKHERMNKNIVTVIPLL